MTVRQVFWLPFLPLAFPAPVQGQWLFIRPAASSQTGALRQDNYTQTRDYSIGHNAVDFHHLPFSPLIRKGT